MVVALLVLLGSELLGELIRGLLHLPVPGPVVGMVLLACFLIIKDRNKAASDEEERIPTALDTVSGSLIANMGLMFVPAGVGVISEAHLLQSQWLPIVGGLVGSTVLSLAVTAIIMHYESNLREKQRLAVSREEKLP
jgi:putative effector of murein hydrolase LrgA (UPF0299 family)